MALPLILITNDDGIDAPGLRCLIGAVKGMGRIVVVAPDRPNSAMSHAITVHDPIRVAQVCSTENYQEYSCTGTPADCMKYAKWLVKEKPTLCLSGINHGQNTSTSVFYSGTIAGAREGALDDIPSIAFSFDDFGWDAHMEPATQWIQQIVVDVLAQKPPYKNNLLINVNLPNAKKHAKYKGIRECRYARAQWKEDFVEKKDPSGKVYYWLWGELDNQEPEAADTDLYAISNGYIGITMLPLYV